LKRRCKREPLPVYIPCFRIPFIVLTPVSYIIIIGSIGHAGSDAMAADAPPTPPLYLHLPDGSQRSGLWSMPTNYAYIFMSYSLNVYLCNDSFWSHDIYSSVDPGEGSSSVALLKVSYLLLTPERFFSISWEFSWSDVRSKVRGCPMCKDCKALWGKLVFCDNGLYKINWIESNWLLKAQHTFQTVAQSSSLITNQWASMSTLATEPNMLTR